MGDTYFTVRMSDGHKYYFMSDYDGGLSEAANKIGVSVNSVRYGKLLSTPHISEYGKDSDPNAGFGGNPADVPGQPAPAHTLSGLPYGVIVVLVGLAFVVVFGLGFLICY